MELPTSTGPAEGLPDLSLCSEWVSQPLPDLRMGLPDLRLGLLTPPRPPGGTSVTIRPIRRTCEPHLNLWEDLSTTLKPPGVSPNNSLTALWAFQPLLVLWVGFPDLRMSFLTPSRPLSGPPNPSRTSVY